VHVGGAVLRRLEEDRVDEADERDVGDAVLGLEIGEVFLLLCEELLLLDDRACAERLGGPRELANRDEDVLTRGDAELERVPRREPQLVDAVEIRRVGNRDAQVFAASSSTPVRARSTSGSWCRAASMRAIPSGEATPSSTSADASERVCCARPRASASLSSGTSFVAASRSATSSTDSLTPKGVESGSPAWPVSAAPVRSDGSGLLSSVLNG
jgi:hypothetical protein